MQNRLVEDGLSTASTLSWVGSITIACNAIFSVLSARVLRSLGSRRTAFLGIALLAGGEILAGFCTKNIGGLFVTEGVVMGTGVSLSFIVVGSNPAQYFHRRRGIANGIVFACGGLGGAVISFLMEALIEKVGSAWTLRILGFLTLATGWPAAWFVRDRVPPSRRTFVDWQLFKDSRFLLLFLAGGVATFPLLVRCQSSLYGELTNGLCRCRPFFCRYMASLWACQQRHLLLLSPLSISHLLSEGLGQGLLPISSDHSICEYLKRV